MIETLCAWCSPPRLLRDGRILAGPVPPPGMPVSHGICRACRAAMEDEARAHREEVPRRVALARLIDAVTEPPRWDDTDPDGDYLRP